MRRTTGARSARYPAIEIRPDGIIGTPQKSKDWLTEKENVGVLWLVRKRPDGSEAWMEL